MDVVTDAMELGHYLANARHYRIHLDAVLNGTHRTQEEIRRILTQHHQHTATTNSTPASAEFKQGNT